MNIAFLGGRVAQTDTHETSSGEWLTSDPERFVSACRRLGGQLFRLRHTLVVASDALGTADYHAVEGAMQALDGGLIEEPGAVIVVKPEVSDRIPFAEWRRRYPRLFIPFESGPPDPQFVKLMVMHKADAAVIVGGAEKSYFAGIAGAISGRRVVPIGAFGGAGLLLSRKFEASDGSWGKQIPSGDVLSRLRNPWSDEMASITLEALGLHGPRRFRIFIVHGRSQNWQALQKFLNRVGRETDSGLEVTVMREEVLFGLTVPQKFQELAEQADGAIVLATPEDLGTFAGAEGDDVLTRRARQNVWLEFGWFWARLGLSRVLWLQSGEMEIPSDLQGLMSSRYKKDPEEASEDIRKFLNSLRAAPLHSSAARS